MRFYHLILTLLFVSCQGPYLPFSNEIAKPLGPAVVPTSIPMFRQDVITYGTFKDSQTVNTIPWYAPYTSFGEVEDTANVNLLVYQKYYPIDGKWNVPMSAQQIPQTVYTGDPPSDSFTSNKLPNLFG